MILSNDIEQVVTFTVPLTPPSVNHHTKPCKYIGKDGFLHTGRKLTGEAKAFKDAVAIFARRRTVAPATPAERRKVKYKVLVDVYLGPNQRLDADNCGKLLCDSLAYAGVIHSDAFVGDFRVRPHKDDRQNPRSEFFVSRMEKE
jgi:Holliday junction resolvase RusA-like endonuclease